MSLELGHAARFTAQKIAKRIALLRPLIRRAAKPIAPFELEILASAHAEPGSGERMGLIEPGAPWAGQNTCFALRSRFSAPAEWREPALFLPLGEAGDIFSHPEAMIEVDGRTLGAADRHHHLIALPRALANGAEHALRLHGWTGLTGWPPDPADPSMLVMGACQVVDVDRALQALLIRAQCALEAAELFDDARPEKHDILSALDRAFLILDTRDPLGDALRASVPEAASRLDRDLERAGPPLPVTLHGVGHAHLDIAYLWPIAQGRRKNARVAANVLGLMERFEELRFSHSQPALYAWLERDAPELFEGVAARIAEGRWELLGGMWVEPDLNIPSGEALARQILFARRYALSRFGEDAETPVLWLPDTFGFPGQIPQLMKLAGLRWFATNKVNWSQWNPMPSSTTWWEGIDGSKVLAHFFTTPREVQHLPFPTNYKSDLTGEEVLGTWSRSTAKEASRDLAICWGFGDGGGGPSEELALRARAWTNIPGAPRFAPSSARAFFEAIEARAGPLPIWTGEIYLEGHRGVLTSQGWIKRANRRAEALLHDAEAAAAIAGAPADLEDAWKSLCVHQFHDIVTGASISRVFEEARSAFEEIESAARTVLDEALRRLGEADADAAIVFDGAPLPAPRLVRLPEGWRGARRAGVALPVQEIEGGVLAELPVARSGYRVRTLERAFERAPIESGVLARLEGGAPVLENAFLRVEFAPSGDIAQIIDLEADRALLTEPTRLEAFEDRPLSWDAWDVDPFFEDRREWIDDIEALEIVEAGPLRASVLAKRRYRDSRIVQRISLERRGRRIDFATEIDWSERHILLKAAFPTNLSASFARYEIQFGHIERPSHRNTSWDAAKFENAAQRWIHLGEPAYGAAISSDGKYGGDVRGGVMRLSLLKSSTSPDPIADLGRHAFTYAFLPHPGADLAPVRREAHALNQPLRIVEGRRAETGPPIVSLHDNVIVETIKPAEDGRGTIVRLYEAARSRTRAAFALASGIERVERAGLLEEPGEPIDARDGGFSIEMRPFEILTLRLLAREGS